MTQKPDRRARKIRPMTPGVSSGARLRAYLAGATLTLGLVGLGFRAWALQVDDNDHYRALADRQHAMTVEIPAPRGDVRDVNGEPLAISADTDSIWASPREIHDVTRTAERLSPLIGIDAATLEAKLGTGKKFVWLDRHVDQAVADAVRAAKIPGIEIAREPKRWYPSGSLAGPIIGRSDIDGNGVDGIELSMNEQLTGENAAMRAVRDARGHRAFSDGVAQVAAGGTVKLTLDRNIQSIAESALATSVINNKAASGVAVVLEVSTGRVLGMATYPVYDPNKPEQVGNGRNRPVTDAFEAGSVMKLFTVAAALEQGVVSPDTEFDIGHGSMMIPGRPKPITDTHHEFASLTVSDIIKHSSNVGAAKIALRMGSLKLYDQLIKLGFGAKTGIELPGETPGMLRKGSKWRDVELATIAFGYGLTISPIQIAGAVAAIGNDGMYNPPRIIDSVTRDGKAYTNKPEPRRVLSVKTATQLRKMMASVMERGKFGGTGGAAKIVAGGYLTGGKTGTAHKYDQKTHQYADHKYLSSFVGLAPIDNPKLAIIVMVDDPSGGDYFGGQVSGPVFGTIASEALRYLGVPGTTLQCPPDPPGYNPALDSSVKTCTIPAPPPPRVSKADLAGGQTPLAKPAAKPVSDGNSLNLQASPAGH